MPVVPFLDLVGQHRELEAELRAAIDGVIASSGFIGGAEVRGFEAEFANLCGVRHAIGVANGTDAIVLALRALGVGPGDKVLTVPFTFLASVEAIDLVGATPILVDIDERDFTIDVGATEKILRRGGIKALIAVDLFGQPADMEPLTRVARQCGVAVVEDAAQAHGARLKFGETWRRAGALGDIACFSFYPTKNLGAFGDAGAVTTDDDHLAEQLRLFHDHGQAERYRHVLRGGTNSRLDAIQAAVLRVKLRYLDGWNQKRRQVAAYYDQLLAGSPVSPPWVRPGAEPVYHQYVVRVEQRASVEESLRQAGVHTAVHYPIPVHFQPAFASLGYGPGTFPVSERCASEVLSLPIYPSLEEGAQRQVVEALFRAVAR